MVEVMEDEKLNIASILQQAPYMTELYSPLFGKCFLDKVYIRGDERRIRVYYGNYDAEDLAEHTWEFNEYGECLYEGSKTLLMPTKYGSWNSWQNVLIRKGNYCRDTKNDVPCLVVSELNDLKAECIYPSGLRQKVLVTELVFASDKEMYEFQDGLKRNGKELSFSDNTITAVDSGSKKEDGIEPFTRVLVRRPVHKDYVDMPDTWRVGLFTHKSGECYLVGCNLWKECVVFGDDTKHLTGTEEDYNKD